MSVWKLPKIENNILFTPSFLIFTGLATYVILNQNLKNSFSLYQPIIAFACLFFLFGSFIFNFFSLERVRLYTPKAAIIWANTILLVLQFYIIYMAVISMTLSDIPTVAVGNFTLAVAIFLCQCLINGQLQKFNFLVYLNILLGLIWGGMLFFGSNFLFADLASYLNVRFLQFIAGIMLTTALMLFLHATRKYVKFK